MYLGIDYGRKRIGLAVGKLIPKGLGSLSNTSTEEVIEQLKEICQEYDIEKIIFGLPLRTDNAGESQMSEEVKLFAEKIKQAINLPIDFEEEQYTSEEAKRLAQECSSNMKSVNIDEMAAVLILEQYIGGKSRDT